MKKIVCLLAVLTLFSTYSFAQNNVEMADVLRSSGKIYVVVAVMGVLFLGLFLFLFSIDRKVKKLENKGR
jgi:bacteriorhodopsin